MVELLSRDPANVELAADGVDEVVMIATVPLLFVPIATPLELNCTTGIISREFLLMLLGIELEIIDELRVWRI